MLHDLETGTLGEFTRNASDAIASLKASGQPRILTVEGEAAVVIQDIASYRRLLALAERADAIEGIRRGLESAARGEGIPAAEAVEQLRARHGIPRKP